MVTWTQPPPHDGESEVCLSHSPRKFIHSPYNKILFTQKLCVQILMNSHCFLIHCLRISSCREHLTQRGAALPGKTQLACFYRGCLSIHQVCCSHSQDMLLPGMFGRYHGAVSHSEKMFLLLSLPTRRRNMRRQPFLLTLLLCFMVMALLSPTKPPACSCYEQGKVQHFYSTCNNVETGI